MCLLTSTFSVGKTVFSTEEIQSVRHGFCSQRSTAPPGRSPFPWTSLDGDIDTRNRSRKSLKPPVDHLLPWENSPECIPLVSCGALFQTSTAGLLLFKIFCQINLTYSYPVLNKHLYRCNTFTSTLSAAWVSPLIMTTNALTDAVTQESKGQLHSQSLYKIRETNKVLCRALAGN